MRSIRWVRLTHLCFLSPLDEQGFDIKSDIIEKELSNDGSTATVRLASDKNLSLVGNPGDTINLAVTQSPSYIPVSTKITNVVKAGDDYTLSFKSINFDYKFFAAGDNVQIESTTAAGTIKEIKQDTGELVVTSTSDLTDVVGDRIESLKVYRANGTFDNYIVESDGSITATITGVSDNFIDSNNNRGETFIFEFDSPKHGSEFDRNGTIVTSPFSITPDIAPLTQVIYRINRVDYKREPAFDPATKNVVWTPGDEILVEGLNTIKVTYMAGQNVAQSVSQEFIAKKNPKTSITSTQKYFDSNQGLIVDAGVVFSKFGSGLVDIKSYGFYEVDDSFQNEVGKYYRVVDNVVESYSTLETEITDLRTQVLSLT